jgi:signal peptidase II
MFKRVMILVAIVFICAGCDQATKSIARHHLFPWKTYTFLDRAVRLEYVENPGAFLSAGADLSEKTRFLVFTVIVAAALSAFSIYVAASGAFSLPQLTAVSLVIGGGAGNLADRLINNGKVIDFVSISISYFHTGIFNLADAQIMTGIFFFLIFTLRRRSGRRAA